MDGLRYAVRRRDLLGTYLIDIVGDVHGDADRAVPGVRQRRVPPARLLGLLYTAETVGSLLATASRAGPGASTITAARRGRRAGLRRGDRAGRAGRRDLARLLACFAVAGAGDMVSGIFRGTIWHQTIPDAMRGRLAGIEMLSYSLGPLGGQVRSGLVADAWGVRAAIASGGLLCMVGVALTAAWLRDFWPYDDRTDEHAVRERELRREREEAVVPLLVTAARPQTSPARSTRAAADYSASGSYSCRPISNPAGSVT